MADPWTKYPFLTSGQSYRLDRFFMRHPWAKPGIAVAVAVLLIILAYGVGRGGRSLEPFSYAEPKTIVQKEVQTVVKTIEVPGPSPPEKILVFNANAAYLVGGWGDNLRWDGFNVKPLDGSAIIKVDPDHNIGSVIVELDKASINSEDRTYLDGDVRIEFTGFHGVQGFQDGGIARNVEVFGNTGRETDLLPRVTASLAGWGTAEVLLNGEPVYSKLPAFFMINDALRRDDNSISLPDGRIFSPNLASTGGFADPRRKELTLMLHSTDPDKKNKPPVSIFIHLIFKDVWEGDVPPHKRPLALVINTTLNNTNAT